MSIEIEIDPMVGAAPFGASEEVAVKAPRSAQIVDREGKMERRQCHRPAIVIADGPKQ